MPAIHKSNVHLSNESAPTNVSNFHKPNNKQFLTLKLVFLDDQTLYIDGIK